MASVAGAGAFALGAENQTFIAGSCGFLATFFSISAVNAYQDAKSYVNIRQLEAQMNNE